MASSVARYFTPAEANALLSAVVDQLGQVSEHVRRARAIASSAEPGEESAARSRLGEIQRLVERLLDGLQAEGVHVKGVDPALLDFPALRQGQEVYLCWREGEEQVDHWHPLHTGYAGRQPVDLADLGIWEWYN